MTNYLIKTLEKPSRNTKKRIQNYYLVKRSWNTKREASSAIPFSCAFILPIAQIEVACTQLIWWTVGERSKWWLSFAATVFLAAYQNSLDKSMSYWSSDNSKNRRALYCNVSTAHLELVCVNMFILLSKWWVTVCYSMSQSILQVMPQKEACKAGIKIALDE